jgi:hypothetical protein
VNVVALTRVGQLTAYTPPTPEQIALKASVRDLRALLDSPLLLDRYQAGVVLLHARNEKLWRAGPWRTFDAFVRDELGMSTVVARDLLKIVHLFTAQDLLTVGWSKLVCIVGTPRELHPELLAYARAHTRAELNLHIANRRPSVPAPARAASVTFTVPEAREWDLPLVVRAGSGPPVAAREVGSAPVLGGASLAPNVRLSLVLTRTVDGTLRARVRMIRTKAPPRNLNRR